MTGTVARDHPDRLTTILKAVSGIASTLALLTALLYYFGWVRSEAQAKRFGADASVFGMTTQELVIRSADVLFVPLVGVALGLVAALWVHGRLVRAGTGDHHRATVLKVAAGCRWLSLGCLAGAVTLLIISPTWGPLLLPFVFAAGVGSAWYAHELRLKITPGSTPTSTPMFLALAAVMAISLFWMAERAARIGGEAGIDAIQADVAHRLGPVTLTTSRSLLPADGPLRETPIAVGDQAPSLYRYDGIYLLQRSGGAYFFVTDGWSTGTGRLFLVPESDVASLDFGSTAATR